MTTSQRKSRLLLIGLAVALASVLLFLYLKTAGYQPSRYFESIAVLHQIKQLDAQWELNVLKSKIGISSDYDSLVAPLQDSLGQWERFEGLEAEQANTSPDAWSAHRTAYLQAVMEKTRLVERFKSHNAVLHNSLSFIPIAEDDVQTLLERLGGDDPSARGESAALVFDVTLSIMEYAQAPSTAKSAEVQALLGRLKARQPRLPAEMRGAVDILAAHIHTVLREQPLVNELIASIDAVPVVEHLDDIIAVLTHDQQRAAAENQLYYRYLLIFSVVVGGLLLYAANRLMRSYAVINRVNRQLQAANEGLEQRVRERTHELQAAQSELVATARQAGMAEIATNVLHNVGNVLNSVNISADLVGRRVRDSKSQGLAKAVQLMNEHAAELGEFMTRDERGKLLPGYLNQLAEALATEQRFIVDELKQLTASVDHIKEIVATQQSYAGTSGLLEPLRITDLIEDALRMNAGALTRHRVTVVKEYEDTPLLLLDKHRLLLILINLISNAKHAMSHIADDAREIVVSTQIVDSDRLRITVRDVGEGIAPENLTRMFAHGFTTRKNGHGFGLHSCALAALEMDGTLRAHSDGPGKGATFTLEIPFKTPTDDL